MHRLTNSLPKLSFITLVVPFLLSFLLLLPCTRQNSLWTVNNVRYRTSSWSPPNPFHLFSTTFIYSRLRYPILFQLALLLFSPIHPLVSYDVWLATSFLAYIPSYILYWRFSTFSRVLFVLKVCTLFLVLLLILYYYPSYFIKHPLVYF